jgi:hypothetical protein
MNAEAAVATPVPILKFNPAASRENAISHVDALLATIRGLMKDVGENGDDEDRSRAGAAHYLAVAAEAITEGLG